MSEITGKSSASIKEIRAMLDEAAASVESMAHASDEQKSMALLAKITSSLAGAYGRIASLEERMDAVEKLVSDAFRTH